MCRGVPGVVATEGPLVVGGFCDRWGLQRGPLQLGARGPRFWLVLWLVLPGRAKEGKLGGWWRGPPPFLHADFLWRVNPWNARSLNKGTQGHLRATVGVCAHLHEAKLVGEFRNERSDKFGGCECWWTCVFHLVCWFSHAVVSLVL